MGRPQGNHAASKTASTLEQQRTDGADQSELHLDIAGEPHLIKLYFKGKKISKQRVDVALHLLNSKAAKGTTAGILDLRRSKLYVPTVVKPGMASLLKAEAAAFTSLWEEL